MASQPGFKNTEHDCLLFAEGNNDCHVISALCKSHDVPQNFAIFDSGSDQKAIKKFSSFIQAAENKKCLGLVLDADDNLAGRWQSLRDKLALHSIILPKKPDEEGTIIAKTSIHPTIGIWLMPNNVQYGMIEDFCCEIAETAQLDFAKTCVAEAKTKKLTSFKEAHRKKAEIHTYLAWQDEPGMPMGQAITARILNADHQLAKNFTNWLKKLFQQQ